MITFLDNASDIHNRDNDTQLISRVLNNLKPNIGSCEQKKPGSVFDFCR